MANIFDNMLNILVDRSLNRFIKENGGNITQTQQEYIDTIRSRNANKGVELATNLCNTMRVTPEQGFNQARQFFHI